MTVSSPNSRMDYPGNGSTATFAYTYRIFDEADLLVTRRDDATGIETTLTLNGVGDDGYTVDPDGVDNPDGGEIVLTGGNLENGYTLSIRRVLDVVQETDLRNQGAYYAEDVERQFDRQVMIDQQQQDEIDRSIKIPETADPEDFDTSLPVPEADKLIGWNGTGTGLENFDASEFLSALERGNYHVDTFVDGVGFTAGVTTQLTLSASPGSENNTLVTFDGVVQHKTTYSLAAAVLTFSSAIPVGVAEVQVAHAGATTINEPADGSVTMAKHATQAARTVIANDTASDATPTARSIDDLTVLADGSTTRRDLSARFTDIFNVKDWGATGDGTTDDRAAIQACVTAGANAGGTIFFPAGNYKVSAAITFPTSPAKSFVIAGASATGTAIKDDGSAIRIFDFSGCNGPAVLIRDISLNGNGVTAVATGAYVSAANGISFHNVWFRGLNIGIQKAIDASYISLYNCVLEYCNSAVVYADAVQCIFSNLLFYRNLYDIGLSGALHGFTCSNLVIFETQLQSIILTDASDGLFQNIVWRQDFAAYTPELLVLEGASSRNVFNGLVTKSFGTCLIKFPTGATGADNRFSNIQCTGLASGVAIILASGCLRNRFEGGIVSGCLYGVQEVGQNSVYENLRITACTNGILVQGAVEPAFYKLRLDGNTNTWVTVAVATVWIDEIDGVLTGLTPTRLGRRGGGSFGRTFYGAAAPVSLTYQLGDRVLNVNPAVGSPKAWTCTVAGTPGTWVSEGNL